MSAKTLIEVDIRIAVLREQTAAGNADAETNAQIAQLLKARADLIDKMIAARAGQSSCRSEYTRVY